TQPAETEALLEEPAPATAAVLPPPVSPEQIKSAQAAATPVGSQPAVAREEANLELRLFAKDPEPVGHVKRAWPWAKRPAVAALLGVSAAAVLALVVGRLWFTAGPARQQRLQTAKDKRAGQS